MILHSASGDSVNVEIPGAALDEIILKYQPIIRADERVYEVTLDQPFSNFVSGFYVEVGVMKDVTRISAFRDGTEYYEFI